jgi:hypothetical protein
MRSAAKISIAIGAAAAWLGGIGLSGADPDSQAFDQIERGRYLTTVADCFACHTVPQAGKPFAGARGIETPFGTITSSNITPVTTPASAPGATSSSTTPCATACGRTAAGSIRRCRFPPTPR